MGGDDTSSNFCISGDFCIGKRMPGPGSVCAVAVCPNPDAVSYFRFPKDETLCKAWVKATRRKDKFNPLTSRICEKHFREEDFIRDLKSELLGTKKKPRLYPTAIPSRELEPPRLWNKRAQPQPRSGRLERKEHVEAALEAHENSLSKGTQTDENLIKRIDDLEHQNKVLLAENQQQKAMLKMQQKDVAKEELSKFFSPGQVSFFMCNGEKQVRWTEEDILTGLLIKSISNKAYKTLQKKKMLPLPSERTLRRWTSEFKCKPGTFLRFTTYV